MISYPESFMHARHLLMQNDKSRNEKENKKIENISYIKLELEPNENQINKQTVKKER